MAQYLSNEVCLKDAPGKDSILIPEYGFFPSNNIIDGIQLNVTKEGYTIAGFPVGPTTFIQQSTDKKVEQSLQRLELAKKFKDIHPQFLFVTIVRCINRSLDYLVSGVPTNLVLDSLLRYDNAIFFAVMDLLRCPFIHMDQNKLMRSRALLCLPTSF